jgi:hypothetical protein
MAERIARMDWATGCASRIRPGLVAATATATSAPLYRLLTWASRVTGIDFNHTNHGRVLDV